MARKRNKLSNVSSRPRGVTPTIVWTPDQEHTLLRLLRENPKYQSALLLDWFPLSQGDSADNAINGSKRRTRTPRHLVTSTLQPIIAQIFGDDPTKVPSQIRSKLHSMSDLYDIQRREMDVEARNVLFREMTGHGAAARWKKERRAVLSKCSWWETFHELVVARERLSQQGASHAFTPSPSEGTVDTGRKHIQGLSSSSTPAASSSTTNVDQQQSLRAARATTHTRIPETSQKAQGNALQERKSRSSRQPKGADKGRLLQAKHKERERQIREQKKETLPTRTIERERTKKLALKSRTDQRDQWREVVSERMDLLEVEGDDGE
ncbi:unnamed protein product [Tilletia controversa]|uniref:Uncharacterized protein n=3 Tax=Tilletia TaxID=13289 RepID=A0A8X7SWX3_9BASI|nr:hypothetical protein CF336_g6476 [Tilletia laevis]KAE8194426.1 hypothetical protein CF328_g4750 [Tilletia controversa]KAE8258110.1 hypothetical protein A4X03_0g4473 [Tilletia caries]KAE8190598.1 hypothetical protein CF335_g6315 [Tilletia laevis]KAE8247828.1 hypothetical protein A4X06_0g4159 [Tilletia controversa]